jgi:hypothetical protein
VDGELALTILDARGDARDQYAFVHERGRAKIEHRAAPAADARLSGTQEDWVRALGPHGSRGALAITGRSGLADEFLALFDAVPAV